MVWAPPGCPSLHPPHQDAEGPQATCPSDRLPFPTPSSKSGESGAGQSWAELGAGGHEPRAGWSARQPGVQGSLRTGWGLKLHAFLRLPLPLALLHGAAQLHPGAGGLRSQGLLPPQPQGGLSEWLQPVPGAVQSSLASGRFTEAPAPRCPWSERGQASDRPLKPQTSAPDTEGPWAPMLTARQGQTMERPAGLGLCHRRPSC